MKTKASYSFEHRVVQTDGIDLGMYSERPFLNDTCHAFHKGKLVCDEENNTPPLSHGGGGVHKKCFPMPGIVQENEASNEKILTSMSME